MSIKYLSISLFVALWSFASPAESSEVIAGQPSVVDGDTIDLRDERFRLHGIDAPESNQTCRDANDEIYLCGSRAAFALDDRISRRAVHCRWEGDVDKYGRKVGVCYLGNEDLGAFMVRSGWALASRKFSHDYVEQESQAQSEKIGLWQGRFVPPWEWRRGVRLDEPAPPEGCDIKGNISDAGHIYHVPGSRWYDRTRVDTSRGERWFCSTEEAEAAGWRAPR